VAVVDLFLELVALPSPSGRERHVAERVAAELRSLGLAVDEDSSAAATGADVGNLLCVLPPTGDGGMPIFLCAHLDTVPPRGAIDPVLEDGLVRNASETILGADNKAAVAAIVEAARRLVEERRRHAGVELVFTTNEEIGLVGAGAFDCRRLRSQIGYVYDQAAPIGEVVLGAPHSATLDVVLRGRAAHSGMYPEEGRSAIVAAARAIADLRLGRIDEETTANVGTIDGGTARNVVPESCKLLAEARSHDEAKLADLVREMTETFAFAAALEECEVESRVRRGYRGYRFRRDDAVVRLARAALERTGFTPTYALSGGGADANVFNERGLACLNLANGMQNIHTPDEQIAAADLEAMVDVTLALVDEARALA
jgi:tripeptide aminopeptidase